VPETLPGLRLGLEFMVGVRDLGCGLKLVLIEGFSGWRVSPGNQQWERNCQRPRAEYRQIILQFR